MHQLEPVPLQVEAPGLFADAVDPGKKATNISGIWVEPGDGPPWHGYVVSDEGVSIQAVTIDGQGRNLTCRPGPSRVQEVKGDLEAIAVLDGAVYATGSWGNDRKTGAPQSGNWNALRFPLHANDGHRDAPDDNAPQDAMAAATASLPAGELKDFFRLAAPELAWSIGLVLQCGGLNIEGLTGLDGKLYLGLRSPSQRQAGVAYVISAEPRWLFPDGDDRTKGRQPKLHRLKFRTGDDRPVAGIGIRALDTIGDRILISTGDAGVPFGDVKGDAESFLAKFDEAERQGGYLNPDRGIARQLWLWDPSTNRPRCLGRMAEPYDDQKIEGACLLKSTKRSLDLLLAVDNPTGDLSSLAVLYDVPRD